jgi:site-specific DNA recombinase
MKAAVYARKSTEQNGVAEDAKSVTRQVDQARAFATTKGWTINESSIFVDDGISGAKFGVDRPELARLLNALKPRQFDVLVVSALDRIGRDQRETPYILQQIHDAGVQVWSYLDARQIQLESEIDVFFVHVQALVATMERQKTSQRNRDSAEHKARAGHVTGGRIFGYDNVPVEGHVERRINDREAAVVRRIFELAALGLGLRAIAHTLNAESQPAPRAQKGRPDGWAPSSVREVLDRSLYRGVIEWGRAPRDKKGIQSRSRRQPAKVRIDAPQLRIVPEEFCVTVDAQRDDRRERYLRKTDGTLLGRPAPKALRHVLSGLLRCSCGATFEVTGWKRKVYVCSAARRKGATVCTNTFRLPVTETEESILSELERDVFDPGVVEGVIELACEKLSRQAPERAEWQAERNRLERELESLAGAVAAGEDVQTLLAEMRKRETRKAQLDRDLARPSVDRDGIRKMAEGKLAEWKRLLRARPTYGQAVLRDVIDGPINVRIGEDGPVWSALGRPERLLGQWYSGDRWRPQGDSCKGASVNSQGLRPKPLVIWRSFVVVVFDQATTLLDLDVGASPRRDPPARIRPARSSLVLALAPSLVLCRR